MKVKAVRLGYYNLQRYREGDVFHVAKADFSEQWMAKLDDTTVSEPSKFSSGGVDTSQTIAQLHEYCQSRGLAGYVDLKKADLIQAINSNELPRVNEVAAANDVAAVDENVI